MFPLRAVGFGGTGCQGKGRTAASLLVRQLLFSLSFFLTKKWVHEGRSLL